MVSKRLINKYKLDQEEIDLMKEEEKEISESENELFFDKAISNLKKKDKLISLRVNNTVIDTIKQKAEYCGIGYQSLINMLLKQYADGKINMVI